MFKVFQKLLEIRVVEPVPTQEGDFGICSTFFTILKKENDWWVILDLKFLNSFIIKHFHMETIR